MAEVDTIEVKDANGVTKEVPTLLSVETILGEVSASPTTNTLADRLKAIADALGGTLTVGSHEVTNGGTFAVQAEQSGSWSVSVSGTVTVDSHAVTNAGAFAVQESGAALTAIQAVQAAVEGTLTVDLGTNNDVTLATLPDTAAGDLAAMVVDLAAIEVLLTTQAGYLDGVEALLGTIDADTGSMATLLGTIDTDTGNVAAGYATEGSALGSGVLVQGDDGTDRHNLQTDGSGNLKVSTNGQAFEVQAAPTVTAGAYTADDVFGVKMTLANAARVSGGGGIITSVALFDEGPNGEADSIDVFIFRDDPSSSTFSDNAALAIVDADGPKIVACVQLDQIYDTGDGKFLLANGLNIPYVCAATSLYAVAVHRGTWAPDATDGVTFTFQMIRD